VSVEQELEIAEDIMARPAQPIPYKRYVQIYRAGAKRYGFAEDWYVLAAVGSAESNHGENMGPSSAGAMGPMQFLPSTWEQYGLDGNRDGEANIMDPEPTGVRLATKGWILTSRVPRAPHQELIETVAPFLCTLPEEQARELI
jgi:soluble lytic murein transglycosylase-like protein